jgi:hypothetical protein
MAKKGVVIFDGEDMFINPKKAIYSKTRGEAKNASFMSARGDDGPGEEESPSDDGPMGRERIMREGTSGGGSQAPSAPPTLAPSIVDEPIAQQVQAPSQKKTAVEPDTITIKSPIAEIPTIVVPPILPPNYLAPTPDVPTRPTPPQRPGGILEDDFIAKRPGDDGSGNRYSGPDNNPGLNQTPIYTIDDGTPAKPVIDTPRYVAPTPVLPEVKQPPAVVVIPDPLGGGGSPVLTKDPEIPKLICPAGFILGPGGECVPTQKTIDEEIKKIGTSTTTTTTTKSTSTTETTTTKAPISKVCNPPIYAAPKYYKWVDKGNCTFELAIDNTQIKDAAPAPVLPAAPGQPIFNLTLPTGGLGTLPTATPTKTPLEELPLGDSGGASGGGGGSPFPEELAPIVEEPKKNYFWWYVGGALAIFLLIKRKKSQ